MKTKSKLSPAMAVDKPMPPGEKTDMGNLSIRGKAAKDLMHLKPGKKFQGMVHGTVRSISADQYGSDKPEHRVSVDLHHVAPGQGGMSYSKTTRKGI